MLKNMKSAAPIAAITLAMLTSQMSFASQMDMAASQVFVSGTGFKVEMNQMKDNPLYNASDIAKALKATYSVDAKKGLVTIKLNGNSFVYTVNSAMVKINGKSIKTAANVTLKNGKYFIDASPLFSSTGMAIGKDSKGQIHVNPYLQGTVVSLSVTSSGNMLIGMESVEGNGYYLLDMATMKTTMVIGEDKQATEAVISPDAKKIAYANGDGGLFVKNLSDGHEFSIAGESDPKFELTWSKDSNEIYFLMGEKIDVLARVNLNNVYTQRLVEDKVPYKSDMILNDDYTKVAYLVTKTATLDDKNENMPVDTKGTEPQYFTVDLKVKGAKAVQMTKSLDNKLSGTFLADGNIVFISAKVDSDISKVVKTSADGSEPTAVYAEQSVISVQKATDGGFIAITTDTAGNKTLVRISIDGTAKKIVSLDKGSYAIHASTADSALIAALTDDGERVLKVNLDKGISQAITN